MLEELYERYNAPLLRFCLSLTRSEAAAEDLAQETFLRALGETEMLSALGEPQRRAWLYKTAKNLFIDRYRRELRLTPLDADDPPVWTDDSSAAVASLLQRLPEKERALFSLHYFTGYTSSELGEMFGLSPSTVRVELSHARAALRKLYLEE